MAKFTGKHLCHIFQACDLIKRETPTELFLCESYDIFQNSFLWNISEPLLLYCGGHHDSSIIIEIL